MPNIEHWATSYAITSWQLYIGFPLKKYLSIYSDFNNSELIALCGRIFAYFMKLVIEDVIDNNVMLKFPPGVGAYLEMNPVSGENFKIARLNGAFQDIDFLSTNFTGYQLVLRFQNRYGKWLKRLYVSAPHRDKIVKLSNEGKSLVSFKTKEVKHYVDKVQEEFPILSKSELNKICTYGLKRYAWANRLHCDVLICYRAGDPLTAYCGVLLLDTLKHFKRWHVKWRMKERVLYYLKKKEWDGYYYIGLDQNEHEKILSQHGKFKKFGDVFLVKVKEELYHDSWCKHIWRIPYPAECGWKFLRLNLITDKAEYIEQNKYGKIHKYLLKWNDE